MLFIYTYIFNISVTTEPIVNFGIFGTVMLEEIGVHIMRFLHGRMQV